MKKSNYIGVAPIGNQFRAAIFVGGRRHSLGCFPDEVDAAKAYDNAVHYLAGYAQRNRRYNFPSDYVGENPPLPLPEVSKVIRSVQESPAGKAGDSLTALHAELIALEIRVTELERRS